MDVSNETLCARLDELASAVSKGRDAILREFYMSIPARPDHDADLVLALAAKRIRELDDYQACVRRTMDLYHNGDISAEDVSTHLDWI